MCVSEHRKHSGATLTGRQSSQLLPQLRNRITSRDENGKGHHHDFGEDGKDRKTSQELYCSEESVSSFESSTSTTTSMSIMADVSDLIDIGKVEEQQSDLTLAEKGLQYRVSLIRTHHLTPPDK